MATLAVYSFKIQLFYSTPSTFQYPLYTNIIYIYINLYRVNMDGLVWHHEMHLDSLDDAGC